MPADQGPARQPEPELQPKLELMDSSLLVSPQSIDASLPAPEPGSPLPSTRGVNLLHWLSEDRCWQFLNYLASVADHLAGPLARSPEQPLWVSPQCQPHGLGSHQNYCISSAKLHGPLNGFPCCLHSCAPLCSTWSGFCFRSLVPVQSICILYIFPHEFQPLKLCLGLLPVL